MIYKNKLFCIRTSTDPALEEKAGKFSCYDFILNFRIKKKHRNNLNNKIELQHEFLLLERSLPDFAAGGEYPD
jgi:hypothetical protein